MEPDLERFLKAFDQNHVRRDARLEGVVERFKNMSPEDLTYTISSLYKNTTSDEYKLSWRDAAMSVYLGKLTDRLITGMSDLEKSNERLATKTNDLIVAVGDEGGYLTVVVGAVAMFLTAVLTWVSTSSEFLRPAAGVVAVLSVLVFSQASWSHRRRRARKQ